MIILTDRRVLKQVDWADGFYCLSRKASVRLAKKTDKDNVVESAIDQVFDDGKVDATTRKKLIETHYAPLKEGVNEGFHKEIVKVEYGTPNYEFLKQLQTNAACFAAFKAHAQINEMTALVTDENGKVRSKAEFKQKAWELDANYRGAHLDVEYDTCVRNARSAAQWQKAQSTKRIYPNIKYVASKSAHPRNAHQPFYGLIRPIDDPIWNSILPINAWGCKCSWIVTDEDVTDIPSNLPAPDPAFAFNPGKAKKVFDLEKSDYYKSSAKNEREGIMNDGQTLVETEQRIISIPQVEYTSPTKCKVEVYQEAKKEAEFKQNFIDAKKWADSEFHPDKMTLLPRTDNPKVRAEIMPGAKGNTSPDVVADGVDGKDNVYGDLKTFTGKAPGKYTIQNAISKAHDQGDFTVLFVPDGYVSEGDLYQRINGKMSNKAYKDFTIILNHEERWSKWNWKEWKAFYENWKIENPE